MARDALRGTWPLAAALALGITGCGGGGGGGGESPTGPPMPAPAFGSARFDVVGAGQDDTVAYDDATNLVFCRTGTAAGWADLWIRFAEQKAADGENGPHLDLDVCAPGDGGSFAPKDPMEASCDGDPTFDVWWHGADGETFVNTAGAPSCTLQLSRSGTTISGFFDCRDMARVGGAGSVDVLGGSFECAEE